LPPVKTAGPRLSTPTAHRGGAQKKSAPAKAHAASATKATEATKAPAKASAASATPARPAAAQDVFEAAKARATATASAPGFCGAAQEGARIERLSSPTMNAAGRVVFGWDKPGDAIPFELTVRVDGDPSRVKADLWTNANHNDRPDQFDALPMKLVRQDGNQATFRVEVPIEKLGNYRATARISTDGGRSFAWCSESGIGDVRFRPHFEGHDALNMMEVNVNSVNGGHGTLDDLAGQGSPTTNGKYTLEFLKEQGVNSVWVQPPFKRSVWDHRHPLDDAGRPYATKSYFAVDPKLSARAQAVLARGGSEEEAEAAATQEWKDFVAKAHSLGIKVVVDVALNHVGHNYEFADLFVRTDAAGREIREVRKNDFAQIAIDPEQAQIMKERLDDPDSRYLESVAPWLSRRATGGRGRSSDVSGRRRRRPAGVRHQAAQPRRQLRRRNEAINREVNEWFGRAPSTVGGMGRGRFRLATCTGAGDGGWAGLNHAQARGPAPSGPAAYTRRGFFNACQRQPPRHIQDTWSATRAAAQTRGPSATVLQPLYFDKPRMVNWPARRGALRVHGDMMAAASHVQPAALLAGPTCWWRREYGGKHSMPFKQLNPGGAIGPPSEGRAPSPRAAPRAGQEPASRAAGQQRAFCP
jgi:hypothetical protein